MTFIDELLEQADAEQKVRLEEMNKVRCDQMLLALAILEHEAAEVNEIADAEIKVMEEYRAAELLKIEKKAGWLEFQLEQFIRSTDEKTINLPHGSLKLRLGRDKVEITDLAAFLPYAHRKGLLRHLEASDEPDLLKLHNYIKSTGITPAGITVIPATTKFTYSTKGNNNGNGKAVSSKSQSEDE